MNRSFRDIPIRRKLTLVIMMTCGIGLLLAGALIVVYEWGSYRQHMIEDLSTLAQVIGDQSTAALAFDDPKTAAENLATLAGKPEITAAAIYAPDGTLFASYTRSDLGHALPAVRPKTTGAHFHNGRLEVYREIKQHRDSVGTIFLEASLDHMRAQLVRYVGIVASVIIVLMLATLLLSAGAQRAIADPILDLARVAQAVSERKDYSVRATRQGNDEIGRLIDTFNEMLVQIDESHNALQSANEALQREVAERQRAEASLAAHADMLELRNRELQEFAYVASHDLQEPLRAIQNFSERLRTKHAASLNEEAVDYLQRMQNAAGRMRVLIQDLLAFSRVTTQGKPFVSTDLNAIVENVVADLSNRLEESGGRIEIGKLPVIVADATQMRQLLQNLLGNALKFRREDEPSVVKVYSVETEEAGAVCLAVEDNGIGFDEKYCDRIFTPFQRLHNQRKYEGTGIGLAICRKIVERHGGGIVVRSAPGQGATFFITLPMSQTLPMSKATGAVST